MSCSYHDGCGAEARYRITQMDSSDGGSSPREQAYACALHLRDVMLRMDQARCQAWLVELDP